MEEDVYNISEISEKLDLETHVLRYWEKELELKITRNEKGHRIYTEKEKIMFENIKLLKDQGLQLRAIKMALPNINNNKTEIINIGDPNDEKVKEFKIIMKDLFKEALVEYLEEFKMNEFKMNEFKMNEFKNEIKEEIKEGRDLELERYKKVDQTLREVLKMRKEIACLNSKKNKFKFW